MYEINPSNARHLWLSVINLAIEDYINGFNSSESTREHEYFLSAWKFLFDDNNTVYLQSEDRTHKFLYKLEDILDCLQLNDQFGINIEYFRRLIKLKINQRLEDRKLLGAQQFITTVKISETEQESKVIIRPSRCLSCGNNEIFTMELQGSIRVPVTFDYEEKSLIRINFEDTEILDTHSIDLICGMCNSTDIADEDSDEDDSLVEDIDPDFITIE